ncbi:MAG: YkoF family thiamine/hydroxymethylpyrimidine-binding protein [Lysobacterales bacterium]
MNQVSIEISLYPLRDDFIPPIAQFIERLNGYQELTVQTNCMSTQVFGEYARTLEIVSAEMRKTHAEYPKATFAMKVLNGNLLTQSPTD